MLEKCEVKSLDQNVFTLIGEQWMLITAGTPEHCNTMTASWGGLGVLWGADVATCYIRPQRYTYEFIEKSDYFTLSFLEETYRKQLALPDFSPLSQDRLAIQLIRERGALDDIRAGRIERAISRCRNIWASLPGAGYGQREHSLEKLVTVWRTAGGVPA